MTDKRDDGGPAFPTPEDKFGEYSQSMSLRDWFAGQAAAGIASSVDIMTSAALAKQLSPEFVVAEMAYEIADAMLKARKK